MEWNYKNTVISLGEDDGRFYFYDKNINQIIISDSLAEAKRKVDEFTKDYYKFSRKDISKLLKKLDSREKDFVNSLMGELDRHRFNAYCELGISDDMLFDWEN